VPIGGSDLGADHAEAKAQLDGVSGSRAKQQGIVAVILGAVNGRPRLTKVSKYLAKYLRHAPGEPGLTLRPGGWVTVNDLLAATQDHRFPISYDGLVEGVEISDKRRFSSDETGDLIRADQGHSVNHPTMKPARNQSGRFIARRVFR
jgi:RNA:NAD 2'-phosphotransferase (TPT1/KptA family)